MSLITPEMRTALAIMAEDPDADMVYEKGAGWWVGCERLAGITAHNLLRLCLVSDSGSTPGVFERYDINEEGRRALTDPNYEPFIVGALLKKQPRRNPNSISKLIHLERLADDAKNRAIARRESAAKPRRSRTPRPAERSK